MPHYNSLPTYNQNVEIGGKTSKIWYFFWQALWNGIPPGAESVVVPTGSPFGFVAPRGGFAIVQGGTVSNISFSRDGVTPYNTGLTVGVFPLSKGDVLTVTYSSAPALIFVPQ
jgi:hypothetical protein